jgi:hypothetical protein
MEALQLLFQNKDTIKILYGLIVLFICIFIVLKSDRLSILSAHQGIRTFRNAFFFYGLAFATRYLVGGFFNPFNVSILFFEFFLIVGGFFLLHSLVWKKFYSIDRKYFSSLFTPITLLFYAMAVLIVLLDFFWKFYLFLFISQIIIFSVASALSAVNYLNRPKKLFPKFYFLAMFFSLIAWVLNALAASMLNWNKGVLSGVYLLNVIVFLLFLMGIISVTKK